MYKQELTQAISEFNLGKKRTDIVYLVSMGLSNEEIANQLFMSEREVKQRLNTIYRKLSLKSRTQLIIWCLAATMTHKYNKEVSK